MAVTAKTLYETDFAEWAEHTAALLREGRFNEIDIENAAEEIEGLARSDRSAIRSQLRRMLLHLVKQRIQPERDGSSWHRSITDGRTEIDGILDDSPSLRPFAESVLQQSWERAVRDALRETGLKSARASQRIPEQCPYTLEDLLESDQLDPQK